MDQQTYEVYKTLDTELSPEELCTPQTFINLPKDEQTEENKPKFEWMNEHDYAIHLQLCEPQHNINITRTHIEEKK